MYGKGKLPPPPPRHPSGPPGAPGPSNPPYPPPPIGHSYSFPHATQSYVPVPPSQSVPHNFMHQTQFSPLGTNPTESLPALPPPPPPPPSARPPPPPPPVQLVPVPPPKPCEEELVPNELKLHEMVPNELDHVYLEREGEREAVASPALSDMDMEDDDDVPAYKKPSTERNEQDILQNPSHGFKSEGKASSPFMEDVSPVRLSSPAPAKCLINKSNNNTNKSSDENLNPNPNVSPFGLILQGYASDDDDDCVGPTSDKDNDNYDNKSEESREESKLKRARSKSPSRSPEERNPKLKRESPPSSTPLILSNNVGPTLDPNQQVWQNPILSPPPPPPPLPPQITNLSSLNYPMVPPLYQSHPSLTFPSHAERWPLPSPLPTYAGINTNTGTSAHFSTITTRYNPYASTFENVPAFGTKYGPVCSKPYDPLSDSIDPVPVLVPDPVPAKSSTVKSADELEEVAAPDAEPGIVENGSPELMSTGAGTEPSKEKKEPRAMKMLKVALADYVKEVLKPAWQQGNISKDAFKTIVKKTVEKVSGSVPANHIPKTPSKVEQYVQASQHKVTKLVMGYVDKYAKS